MKALIPVAGYGTRMRPHTLTQPKVLLPVADKPMIAHIVEKLIGDGIDELIFVVGHLGNKIEEFIRANYQIKSSFIQQTEFLGLGHAIYTARDYLDNQPLIIVLGDTIYEANLQKVIKAGKNSLGVKKVDDPRRFGVALLNKNGFIKKLIEKPKKFASDLALVGIYYFHNGNDLKNALTKLITAGIKTNDEYQLTDALQIMIDDAQPFTTFKVNGWYDCGKPETLLETNAIILKRDFSKKTYKYKNTIIIPPVFIHPLANIQNSIIGPNVTIGRDTKIERSIILASIINSESTIRSLYLRNSIIGTNVDIQGPVRSLNVGDYSELIVD
jgi:glucose-1-phosphate thymidylyltransferase